ncbi:MAG: T9SS type A sorting domain-containing protein [Lewinella sp.]|nr:T9SS type A sorting domain-containing protein [Lewinella sp.]
MKKTFISFLTFLVAGITACFAQTTFINEINYLATNPSSRGVEIAGESGTDLSGWMLYFYNPDGSVQSSKSLNSSSTVPDQQNGHGTIWYEVEQLNSGQTNRGGAALVRPNGEVEQFSSYGDTPSGQPLTINAVEGPASGMSSDNIGKQTSPNKSLQLKGIGIDLLDFIWGLPLFNSTPGQVNTLQIFQLIGGLLFWKDDGQSGDVINAVPIGSDGTEVYPNPIIGAMNIRFERPVVLDGAVELRDGFGRLIQHTQVAAGDDQAYMDCSRLPAGQYYLRFNIDGKVFTKQVIKN